jgi:hypothetical protein
MPKKRQPDEDLVQKWIRQGHGQGFGKYYQPFYKVRDVPSKGRSHRVWGLKNNRIQEYFSDTEYAPNLLSEFAPIVTDIREQFALLPREETMAIAYDLGIRHPAYPGTSTPIVMTTDLVLSLSEPFDPFDIHNQTELPLNDYKLQGYYLPICVKPDKYFLKKKGFDNLPQKEKRHIRRVWEKILIEKIYWERRGLQLRITSPKTMPWNRAWNLESYRISMLAREEDWLTKYLVQYCDVFLKEWCHDLPLKDLTVAISKTINLDVDYTSKLLGRALWMRLLPVDLETEEIRDLFPVRLITDKPK